MLEYSTYFAVSTTYADDGSSTRAPIERYLYGHSEIVNDINLGGGRVAFVIKTSGPCNAQEPLAEDGIDVNVAFAHELANECNGIRNWAEGQRDRLASGLYHTSKLHPNGTQCAAWVLAHWVQ